MADVAVSLPFRALYAGRCWFCRELFTYGDWIRAVDGVYVHDGCEPLEGDR